MDARLAPLAALLRLNGYLLLNCVEGLDDAQAVARPVPDANSVAFVVAHLVDARHWLLELIGGQLDNPLAPYLADARGIDDVAHLPALAQLVDAWGGVSAALDDALGAASATALDAPSPQRYPIDDTSTLGAIAFLVQHDSYHVGQLALLRKALGFPAMRYAPPRDATR